MKSRSRVTQGQWCKWHHSIDNIRVPMAVYYIISSSSSSLLIEHSQDNSTKAGQDTSLSLSELHWLPVNKRINFKIATLAYQSLAFDQPNYLSLVLTPHQPQRSLRSVNQNLLSVPHCNSSFGQRSFSYCAPKIWNDTPLLVRQSPSLDSFKRNLKTHYFANNWQPGDCLQRLRFDILNIMRSTNCYEWMNEW